MVENDNCIHLNKPRINVDYTGKNTGEILIDDAQFYGTEINKFGRLNFLFEKEKSIYVLPQCPALKWLLSRGKLVHGSVYRIEFAGKQVIENGPFRGDYKNTVNAYLIKQSGAEMLEQSK